MTVKKHFICTPEQTFWYSDEETWKRDVDAYDFLGNHCDDGWDSDVDQIIAGTVPDGFVLDEDEPDIDQLEAFALFKAEDYDRKERPEQVDEDGYDSEGTYWGEYQYICSYQFVPVLKQETRAP